MAGITIVTLRIVAALRRWPRRFLILGTVAACGMVTACGGSVPAGVTTAPPVTTSAPAPELSTVPTPASAVQATTAATVSIPEAPGYSLEAPDGPLRRGQRGPRVLALQMKLTSLGYDPGPADGLFGAKIQRAVRSFQRDKGLVIDGSVGPKTQQALDAACQRPATCPTP